MRRLSIALLIGAAAFAQPAEAPRKPHVAGRVVKQNGEPLRHATVTLLGRERYTGTADANGAFAFDGIAPGRYALIAQRVGYASQKYGAAAPLDRSCHGLDDFNLQEDRADWGFDIVGNFRQCIERAPGTMLALTADLEMKDLVIRIAQLGVIGGKVTNQDSEPASGQVMATVREPGAKSARIVSTSTIGPDGEYTVGDLLPGRYYLFTRGANPLTGTQDRLSKPPLEAEVPTYYPSALDESEAVPVDVKAGEVLRGVNILVRRGRVFSIRGTAAMPAGGGLAGTMLATLAPKEGATGSSYVAMAIVGADGTYAFRNVASGAYVISCRTQALFGRREVVVSAADVEGANLTMVPGIAMAGAVKVEGVTPGTWPTVTLAAVDGSSAASSARFDANGAFTFPSSVAPMAYMVRLTALLPGTYVKSIRYGNQDALRGPLDLTGGASGSLDIVLSSKAAALTGKVTDARGDAALGVLVTAWPRKAEVTGGVHSASTDQNGRYEIADLGPGDYFAAAWEDIDPGLAEAPEFLARFQNQAAAAHLEEGARASADVKLVPRERTDAEAAKLP